ncbi:NADPH-dependent FMN reductase [Plantactinospora mayteni]|uniref:NADPH-dependent FMN reductase n=1 Tax=Plantactinospora mayteni TaxID=566021 RepID=UPI00194353AA|nr:NAD(P)H-dependent oxidoreductase [Plantactinospora mayteni]
MSEIVVISGNPRPGSRTRGLATSVAEEVARRESAGPPIVLDLAEYGPALLVPDDPGVADGVATARAAQILVVATPTYKGSYTGVLKVFLDHLPHQGLAGVVAVPVTVGATPTQAAQSERHLRGLLVELGAEVRPGLAVPESSLGDPDLAAGYVATLPVRA